MSARVTPEAWLVTTGGAQDPALWQEALAGLEPLREAGLAPRLVAVVRPPDAAPGGAAAKAEEPAPLPIDTTVVECVAFGPFADSRLVRDAVQLVAARRGRPAFLVALHGDVATQALAREAAAWGAPVVAEVRSWRWFEGNLAIVRDGIGGEGNERVVVELEGTHVLTLAPSFAAVGRPPRDLPVPAVETLKLAVTARDAAPIRMIDTVPPVPDITRAPVVVAGGLGLGSAGAVDLVRDLADALGGAVGGTRPIVDLGWLPQDRLIGATGRAIAPDLYVALGISGATQHVSSIRAGKVVSVNIDPAAAMTRLADLGLVGDVHEVVPALAKAIREYRR